MLKNFKELREKVGSCAPKTVAVACAHDAHTLEAVLRAADEGILRYALVGRKDDILRIGRELGHTISERDVIPAETDEQAAKPMQNVRISKADSALLIILICLFLLDSRYGLRMSNC